LKGRRRKNRRMKLGFREHTKKKKEREGEALGLLLSAVRYL
jgi:hypothetical protein